MHCQRSHAISVPGTRHTSDASLAALRPSHAKGKSFHRAQGRGGGANGGGGHGLGVHGGGVSKHAPKVWNCIGCYAAFPSMTACFAHQDTCPKKKERDQLRAKMSEHRDARGGRGGRGDGGAPNGGRGFGGRGGHGGRA